MSRWKWISTVCVAVLLTAGAIAEDGGPARQKRLVVEAALKSAQVAGDPAQIVEAVQRAHSLDKLAYDAASKRLSLDVTGNPSVYWFFIEDSNRLAIDLYNTVNFAAGSVIEPENKDLVRRVRTSLFQLEPEFVSRIVIELPGPVPVQVDRSEQGRIHFSFADPAAGLGGDQAKTVSSIYYEMERQAQRPMVEQERLVEMYERTRGQLLSQREAILASASGKDYPADLGYLVLAADHETSRDSYRGEIAAEGGLIQERVAGLRAEVENLLKSDFEPAERTAQLKAINDSLRELGRMDRARFDQILKAASDDQRVALDAISTLSQKAAAAKPISAEDSPLMRIASASESESTDLEVVEPVGTEKTAESIADAAAIEVADVGESEAAVPDGETAFVVADVTAAETTGALAPEFVEPIAESSDAIVMASIDTPMIADTPLSDAETAFQVEAPLPIEAIADQDLTAVDRISALMQLALNEEATQPASEVEPILVAQAEIDPATPTAVPNDPLVVEALASELSQLRSHPTAPSMEGMPVAPIVVAADVTPVAEAESTLATLEQVEDAVPDFGLGALGASLADAAAQRRPADDAEASPVDEAQSLFDNQVQEPEVPADTQAPSASETPAAVGGPEVETPPLAAPDTADALTDANPDQGVAEAVAAPAEGASTAQMAPVSENTQAEITSEEAFAARAPEDAAANTPPAVVAQLTPSDTLTSADLATPPQYVGDPMEQRVSIEFRDELLRNIIGLLAQKAGINVIGGADLGDRTVSANMTDVPLRQAMNMLLRLEDFGMVEEEGVFRIVPYEEALQLRRVTRMVPLRNAQAAEVEQTLTSLVTGVTNIDQQVLVAANQTANVVVLSGPMDRVKEFEQLVYELDVAEPTLPTVTEAIRLNYADPLEVKKIVETILSREGETILGKAEADERGRAIVVTDLPVVVEQIRALIQDIDTAVQQVNINSMIVDVTLTDDAATGVDWFVNLLRRRNMNGELIGNLSNMQIASDFGGAGLLPGTTEPSTLPTLASGLLSFGILSSDFDIQGIISAEVNNNNAEILANPKLVTLENQPAVIEIIQEFPFRELTQTDAGGQIASTEFKDIGTTLQVTPRVTYDEDILVMVDVEQSVIAGFSTDGIPITNHRRATTNVRTDNGQTIFIGGLRRMDDRLDVRKVPVLGDLPVLSPLFRTTTANKQNTDLLLFVTCNVLGVRAPDLNGTEQEQFDRMDGKPEVPDSQREVLRTWVKPNEMRDPMWKWRRSK